MKIFRATLFAGSVAVMIVLGLIGCDQSAREVDASKPEASATNATSPTATNPPANKDTIDMQKLKGSWRRPDGGYVLEIRQVDANGQLDAGYLNPKPIRVVSSMAKLDGSAVKVHVELNDVNYPGCKYDLTFIPDRDWLVGTYYQAALQQTFEVVFERIK